MEAIQTEQADQTNEDEVQRNDEVQQARHEQDQDACDQGQQGADGEVNIHTRSLVVTPRLHIAEASTAESVNKMKQADRPDSVTAGHPAMTAIPLGRELLHGSSFLPARSASNLNACLFGIAPGGGYRVSP